MIFEKPQGMPKFHTWLKLHFFRWWRKQASEHFWSWFFVKSVGYGLCNVGGYENTKSFIENPRYWIDKGIHRIIIIIHYCIIFNQSTIIVVVLAHVVNYLIHRIIVRYFCNSLSQHWIRGWSHLKENGSNYIVFIHSHYEMVALFHDNFIDTIYFS